MKRKNASGRRTKKSELKSSDFVPIEVSGEPVSETLLRERGELVAQNTIPKKRKGHARTSALPEEFFRERKARAAIVKARQILKRAGKEQPREGDEIL